MAYKPWDSLAGNPVLEATLEASDVNLDILRGLLERGHKEKKVTVMNFWLACLKGNVEAVKLCLNHMAANDAPSYISLPLTQAIKVGNTEIIDAVIATGADLNNTRYKKSSLDFAIYETAPATVAFFVERVAKVPHQDFWYYHRKEMYDVLWEGRITKTGKSMQAWEQFDVGAV
jgi:hypothetical protein